MKLILLPGFDGTGLLYASFVAALSPAITPLVISYPTDRKCPASDLLDIVLSQLPDNEPYVLLAESFSGPIALKASVLHQNPPSALILCATFSKCPLSRSALGLLRIFGSVLVHCRPPAWLVRRYLLGHAPEETLSLFYTVISSVPHRVLAHRIGVLMEFDGDYAPTSLKCPLLYLQATHDRLVSERDVQFVQARYPTVQVEKIDSPHLILQVQPQLSAQAILGFLAQNAIH